MFPVHRLRSTTITDPATGDITSTWSVETSQGWLLDWQTSALTIDGDRLASVARPRLLRLGTDFPDVIEGDLLAYCGPGGVTAFVTNPASPSFNPSDPALFTTDGAPAPWTDGAFGGLEVPVRRVDG